MYAAGVAFVLFSRTTLELRKVYMLHDHAITRLLRSTLQECIANNNNTNTNTNNIETCADVANNNINISCTHSDSSSNSSNSSAKIMQIANGRNN